MKLKKIVLALGLTVAVSAPVVASATDWLFDTVVVGAGVAGGPVTGLLALGYVGYSEGVFKGLGWYEQHWIDDVAFEKDMPAGYINTAGIAVSWANSCTEAGGKPVGFSHVYSVKEWLKEQQMGQFKANKASTTGSYGGSYNDSASKTSFDDSNRETRMIAAVELDGSTHVGMHCIHQTQTNTSSFVSGATYEAWVSKKDGKFHLYTANGVSGLTVATYSVSEAIQLGKSVFDKAGLAAKKFD